MVMYYTNIIVYSTAYVLVIYFKVLRLIFTLVHVAVLLVM